MKLKKWGDVIVVAENTGRSKAVGCWVAPDTPMAAKYAFHSLDEAGQPSGAANANFEIPGRSSREIRLSFFGAAKASALGAEIPIRIKCHNADGTAPQNGFNTMWLSLNKKRKPDIIPEAQLKNDFLKLRKVGSSRKVRVVSVNHGKTGRVKVSAQKSHKALPVKLNVCELNQKTNKCIGQPRTSLDRIVTAGETVHWRVVVKATAKIPKNIVKNRVVFEMLDKGGINRGQTTFAVQTK